MELIENYNNAIQAIYDHVGFEEDWVICPIDDCSNKYWEINNDAVRYANTEKELLESDGDYYVDEIYKQRFYTKWVYEGDNFTMIFCNPQTDGMKYFRLFDNDKRRNYSELNND